MRHACWEKTEDRISVDINTGDIIEAFLADLWAGVLNGGGEGQSTTFRDLVLDYSIYLSVVTCPRGRD